MKRSVRNSEVTWVSQAGSKANTQLTSEDKKSPSSYFNELACTRTRFNSHLFSPRCTHPLLPVVTSDSLTLPAPISCCWGKVFVRAGTHSHTLARKTARWKALAPPLAERSPEPGTPGSTQHAAPQPSEQKAKASERRCPLIPCALCQLWKQKLLKAARVREHMHAEHPSWNQCTLSPPVLLKHQRIQQAFLPSKTQACAQRCTAPNLLL